MGKCLFFSIFFFSCFWHYPLKPVSLFVVVYVMTCVQKYGIYDSLKQDKTPKKLILASQYNHIFHLINIFFYVSNRNIWLFVAFLFRDELTCML